MDTTKIVSCCECGEPIPQRFGASALLCARCQREHVPPLHRRHDEGHDEEHIEWRRHMLQLLAKANEAQNRARTK